MVEKGTNSNKNEANEAKEKEISIREKNVSKNKTYEKDLYAPVRDYLINQGWDVKGEVKYCDVAAVKEDILLVVEMKTSLNLDVILQAAIRQRTADIVYVAVPKKSRVLFTKRWKNILYLLRRLEIGLLLVDLKFESPRVEEVIKPEPFSRERSRKLSVKRRNMLLKEFSARYGDYNTGGISGEKLVTAYRELALHIAALLEKNGSLSIRELRELGTDDKKTAGVLQKNFYGWFQRVDRGVYELSEKGKKEIEEYRDIIEHNNML